MLKTMAGRRLRWVRWISAVAFGLLGAWAVLRCVPIAHGQSEPAFVVDYLEVSSNTATGRALQRTMYYARRGDGASVRELRGAQFNSRTVRMPAQTLIVQVSDSEKIKTTQDFSAKLREVPRRTRRADCAPDGLIGYESLGTRWVLGYEVYGYRTVLDTGGERVESEHWFAPVLGCYDLQTTARKKKNGEVVGVFQKYPTHVTVGEPSAGAFAVPGDYTEVLPSVFEETVLRSKVREDMGREAAARVIVADCARMGFARRDKEYLDLKKR